MQWCLCTACLHFCVVASFAFTVLKTEHTNFKPDNADNIAYVVNADNTDSIDKAENSDITGSTKRQTMQTIQADFH